MYLKEFSQFLDLETALKEKVLLPGQFLLKEGRFLTIEEFKKEPSTYFSILQAIANGKTTPNEIANECRTDTSAIGTYLSKLVELKLARNEHSFRKSFLKRCSKFSSQRVDSKGWKRMTKHNWSL